jgi:hypothetical protein
MLDAIAEAWVQACRMNLAGTVCEILNTTTDAELTAEVIEGWELDKSPLFGDGEPSHMERNRCTVADLEAAFARYRTHHNGLAAD